MEGIARGQEAPDGQCDIILMFSGIAFGQAHSRSPDVFQMIRAWRPAGSDENCVVISWMGLPLRIYALEELAVSCASIRTPMAICVSDAAVLLVGGKEGNGESKSGAKVKLGSARRLRGDAFVVLRWAAVRSFFHS